MPIDVDVALAAPAATKEVSWTCRDVPLYHLSRGAGRDAAVDPEPSWPRSTCNTTIHRKW